MPDSIEITSLGALPEVHFGHADDLFITVWRGSVSTGTIVQLTAVEDELLRTQGRLAVLNVVTDRAAGAPDARLFRSAAAALKHFDPQVRATAVVLPEPAITARVALEGLMILVGDDQRYRLFHQVEPALRWLDPARASHLAAAVQRFVSGP